MIERTHEIDQRLFLNDRPNPCVVRSMAVFLVLAIVGNIDPDLIPPVQGNSEDV